MRHTFHTFALSFVILRSMYLRLVPEITAEVGVINKPHTGFRQSFLPPTIDCVRWVGTLIWAKDPLSQRSGKTIMVKKGASVIIPFHFLGSKTPPVNTTSKLGSNPKMQNAQHLLYSNAATTIARRYGMHVECTTNLSLTFPPYLPRNHHEGECRSTTVLPPTIRYQAAVQKRSAVLL